jgi:SAM-dependent methyltransferase
MAEGNHRFTGRVSDYSQFRERYDPDILLPRLRDWCGLLPTWLIADIGAGTGMLGDVFLANGNPVLAVEPNAEMRAACEGLHVGSKLKVCDASAEATSLASQSIDLVCVGRAFHWFDVDRSMNEFRRILKPNGWFLSVAFGRAEEGTALNVEVQALLRTFSNAAASDVYTKYARLPEFLTRGRCHEEIEGTMQLSREEFHGLLRSISTAPLPGDARFPEFHRDLDRLFIRHAVGQCVQLATRYWINAGQL